MVKGGRGRTVVAVMKPMDFVGMPWLLMAQT